jgi:hypothetical protein
MEGAVKAHADWVKSLKEMAGAMKAFPLQTDEHKCASGTFYYAVRPASGKLSGLWKDVERHHHDLHKKGGLVIDSIEKQDAKPGGTCRERSGNDFKNDH